MQIPVVPEAPAYDEAAPAEPAQAVSPEDAPTMQIPVVMQAAEELVSSEDAPTMLLPTVEQPAAPEPDRAPAAPEQPRKRRLSTARIGMLLGVISGALVMALVLGVFFWGVSLKNNGKIYPNVYVAGINVGGMNRQQALAAVDEAIESSYAAATLMIKLPDRTLSLSPEQTNVALNAEEAIDQALAHGREGNPFSAVTRYFASRTEDQVVDLQTVMELDTEYIRREIETVAAEIEVEPVATQVRYDEAAEKLIIDVGYPERSLDTEGLFEVIHSAYMQNNYQPLSWSYDEVPCAPVDLSEYAERYGKPTENAWYDPETHTIVESIPGYGFNLVSAGEQIAMAAAGSRLELPLEVLEPEITAEVLEKEMFGTMLFEANTEYVINADRTNNLTLACAAINGMILNPGEVFSFNNAVGERTAEKGYKAATVYSGGQSLSELGGGVCQVASTLYYSTLHLNMEQVERQPHQFVVTYVPYGMDATVYWGHIDYQFRNTLSNPVKILADTENGCVNVRFMGVREDENTVKMEYAILATYPWQEVEELDETKEVGYRQVEVSPYTGYKVVTYKTILDPEGNQISREQEAISTYDKRDQKVIVGPSEPAFDPEFNPEFDPDFDPGFDDPLWPDTDGGIDDSLWPDVDSGEEDFQPDDTAYVPDFGL